MKSPTIVLAAAALLMLMAASRVAAIEKGTQEKARAHDLKPGEYVWEPKASPDGPVDIVISLAAQKLYVYRDGVPIGRSTISSGSKGRETPKGIFMILEKNLTHHSNKYHEASMPFMERLTWRGLAIHGGNLPGYPESHGCVHVPLNFARKLYSVTQVGDTVLIAGAEAKPEMTSDPNLLFSGPPAAPPAQPATSAPATPAPSASPGETPAPDASPAPGATPAFLWQPDATPSGPISIVLTSADKSVYVYKKGVEIGHAQIGGPAAGRPYGNYVYEALAQTLADGSHPWEMLGSSDGAPALDFRDLAENLTMPPPFRQRLQSIITPGTTLVITGQPANPSKPSNPD
jgi:hypothetical protein